MFVNDVGVSGGEANPVRSVCGRCHNHCNIDVFLREGKVIGVEGVQDDPRTKGSLCSKGLAAVQYLNDPRRLLYPVRRIGKRGEGKWKRISWDEALNEIAEKFNSIKKKSEPQAVLFCRGQAATWGFPYDILIRLAHAFGNEPCMGSSECFVPRALGEALTNGGFAMHHDFPKTDLIILWGWNPTFGTPTQQHFIFDAKERGARLIAIDPLRFHIGAKADLFVRIEPGTDLSLALAMMYVIVEEALWDRECVNEWTNDPGLKELRKHLNGNNRDGIVYSPEWAESITGISKKIITDLAREYATTKRACMLTGHGLEGRINVTQTGRATAILKAITGHFDAEGCDVVVPLGPPRNPKFFLNELMAGKHLEEKPVVDFNNPLLYYPVKDVTYPLLLAGQGLIPTPDALRWIDEGRAKAVFMQGGNPLLMLPQPDEVRNSFERLELLVVVDPYLTETAQIADIVLPAATYLERTEISWFKYEWYLPILYLRQKVAQIGEARSDVQIIIDLARKLGLDEYFPKDDPVYYMDEILKPTGITVAELKKHPEGIPYGTISYQKYKTEGINLPEGKVNIISRILEQFNFDPLPVYVDGSETPRRKDLARDYPIIAFSGRPGPMFVHCQQRSIPWIRELRPEPQAMINPKTASEYRITTGDDVLVESPRGKIKIKSEVTNKIGPGQIYIPGGWAQSNYNNIGISRDLDPISGMANYMTCLCRISKI